MLFTDVPKFVPYTEMSVPPAVLPVLGTTDDITGINDKNFNQHLILNVMKVLKHINISVPGVYIDDYVDWSPNNVSFLYFMVSFIVHIY